jgi:hypothetical protein
MTASARLRNLAGCAAVAAAVGVLSVGFPVVNEALPDSAVPSDRPLAFAAQATVVPPPGAELDAETTSPAQGVATLGVGGVHYRLIAQPFPGTLQQLADRTRAQFRGITGLQGVADDQPIQTTAGVAGLQATFVAENRSGWYTVFLDDGVGVTAIVDGNDASLTANRDELEESVRSVAFVAAP